ncbi:MAG: hypothetical protein JKX93_18095 [Rhizobiaceae bacterium]|nr:hypothetical protein [Rhizobiaceae bacterium]MBL4695610.1 hypothetical protein [Rhizobiaceae bacterium]
MLSFKLGEVGLTAMSKLFGPVISIIATLFLLSACQLQPLYGSGSNVQLSDVSVSDVSTRTGQQVRNHLLFLLNGGNAPIKARYLAKLKVRYVTKTLANVQAVQDKTAGSVRVTVRYDLIDLTTSKSVGHGTRFADAAYDRTGQSYANLRAERDAENRAAKQAAEAIKLALASNLSRNATYGAPVN